jgi:hypothetical protein
MKKTLMLACLSWLVSALLIARGQDPPSTTEHRSATSDGADWHLKGEGVVSCPCRVPCPCRTNDKASFGHCEATLYLHVRQGHYGTVNLDNMRVVNTGGTCAMSHEPFAALYFDREMSREQQAAFLKLMASLLPGRSADFPHVRTVQINAQVTGDHYYQISIPGILQMVVDRNFGRSEPPMPTFAAADYFSNVLQYAQNLRYVMRDDEANLNFDYSRRQANYRDVDLDAEQYRSKEMLIQFQNGSGWFNADQQRLIHQLRLPLPDLAATKRLFVHLSDPWGSEQIPRDGRSRRAKDDH